MCELLKQKTHKNHVQMQFILKMESEFDQKVEEVAISESC